MPLIGILIWFPSWSENSSIKERLGGAEGTRALSFENWVVGGFFLGGGFFERAVGLAVKWRERDRIEVFSIMWLSMLGPQGAIGAGVWDSFWTIRSEGLGWGLSDLVWSDE